MTRALHTAAVAPLAALVLALTGCSGGESDGGSGGGSGEASSSPSASASQEATPMAVPPLTFVQQPGGGSGKGDTSDGASEEPSDEPSGEASDEPSPSASESATEPTIEPQCYELDKKTGPAEIAWFGSAVNVTAAGRIVDIRALNSPGVSLNLEDTQQVPLAGRVDKVGGIGEWPLTEDQVTRFIVVRDASDLFRTDLRANQSILPVLHLTVQPDSSVEEFVVEYEVANGQLAEITYPVMLEFAAKCGGDSRGSGGGGGSKGNG